MTDQKTTNDESAQDLSAETGAQDPAGLDKAANDGGNQINRPTRNGARTKSQSDN